MYPSVYRLLDPKCPPHRSKPNVVTVSTKGSDANKKTNQDKVVHAVQRRVKCKGKGEQSVRDNETSLSPALLAPLPPSLSLSSLKYNLWNVGTCSRIHSFLNVCLKGLHQGYKTSAGGWQVV
jgi:hypothetical protein